MTTQDQHLTRHPARRTVLGAGIAGAGALTAAGCSRFGSSGSSSDDGGVQLTLTAWADADQAAQYEEAFAVFSRKHPGTTVKLEWMDVASYQDKLNTKFAAGSPPDVMFLVGRWLGEYASRGVLADLTGFADDLDLEVLGETTLAGSSIDGKVYAVPTGTTTLGLVYNTAVLDEAGLTLPDDTTWTWDDFHRFNVDVTRATGGTTFGTGFYVPYLPTLAMWAGQRGESLFTQDGALGLSAGTVADYFQMTVDLREAGGYPPAGALDDTTQSVEASALGTRLIASQNIPANVFGDYNTGMGGTLRLVRFPGERPTPGYQITPTLLWAAAEGSEHPHEAAQLIDFLTNDPESFAGRAALLGVPVNTDVAAEVATTLPPDGQTFVDFLIDLQDEETQPYYLEPAGAGEIADGLVSIATEVEFGRTTPQQAGERFVADAQAALDRAAG